jgi:hypothetical protein
MLSHESYAEFTLHAFKNMAAILAGDVDGEDQHKMEIA